MAKHKHKTRFWYAVATLVGGTVGAGVFGVPYVFVQAGFIPGLLFLVGLAALVLLLNLMYGEVILRTPGKHQIMGYTEKYLGAVPKRVLLFTFVFSAYGAMLSYMILSGTFLANIFGPLWSLSPDKFSTLFYVAAAILVFLGLRTISWFDLVMLFFFGIVIIVIGGFGASHLVLQNFMALTGQFWFLPFGVILFALSGLSAVPLARETSPGEERKLKRAIVWGTLIPAALYLVFTFFVVGVAGSATSPDAISGLAYFLGQKVVIVGSVFGLFAVSTGFVSFGLILVESFQFDFKFRKLTSWLLVVVPPYLLFALGLRNFIDIIGLVGGLALSVEGIFLLLLYAAARRKGERLPEYTVAIPRWLIYVFVAMFLAAAAYTLIK